jgi:hypothetical protein
MEQYHRKDSRLVGFGEVASIWLGLLRPKPNFHRVNPTHNRIRCQEEMWDGARQDVRSGSAVASSNQNNAVTDFRTKKIF